MNPEDLEALRNIGPTSAAWLRQAGIRTHAQLKEMGAVAAWQQVRTDRPRVSLNLLYALQGALQDKSCLALTEPQKARLRQDAGLSD